MSDPIPAAAPPPPGTFTQENHTILIQLRDGQDTLARSLAQHVQEQQKENERLHNRITASDEKTMTAVTAIKDSLAERGKISGQFIISSSALVLSLLMLVAGFVHFYVQMQVGTVRPDLAAVKSEGDRARNTVERLEREHAAETMRSRVREAELAKDIEWLQKGPR